MIVREEETLRKTAVLQIVCEELFIRSIGSVFNALLFCFGQRKGENLNLDVSSGKIGCQFAGKQLGIGAGQVNITIEIDTKRIDCNLPALHLLNLIQKNINFAGAAFRFFCDVVVKRFCSTGVAEAHGLKIGLNNVLCGNIALEEHVLDLPRRTVFPQRRIPTRTLIRS